VPGLEVLVVDPILTWYILLGFVAIFITFSCAYFFCCFCTVSQGCDLLGAATKAWVIEMQPGSLDKT